MYSYIQLRSRKLIPVVAFATTLLLAGCSDDIENLRLSEVEKARILQLQNPFGENYVRFTVSGEKEPVILGLKACEVYRAKSDHGVVTEWIQENTLHSFYPLWSACSRESLKQDAQFIRVSFCKTPLGAGGGCAGGGGNFRSINGIDWQVLDVNDKWNNVVKHNQAKEQN